MIDASKVYEYIKKYASLNDNTFCGLHKCVAPDICRDKQHHLMLNFDEVKNHFCRIRKISPHKSADGLSYNANGILFIIEIKGWEAYYIHSNPNSGEKIQQKVAEYKLPKKLSDSLMICKDVLNVMSPITLPIVYLVVSDINNEGIESIERNLLLLSETSTDFSKIYSASIKSVLNSIPDIDVGFVENCRKIDEELDSWTRAREVHL